MELTNIINKYSLNESIDKNIFCVDKTSFLKTLTASSDLSFLNDENVKKLFFDNDEYQYVDTLYNSEICDECEYYDAIQFFEDKKNEYRCVNKEFFEYYDQIQEIFYKKMELYYPNEKDEYVEDRWDKPLITSD